MRDIEKECEEKNFTVLPCLLDNFLVTFQADILPFAVTYMYGHILAQLEAWEKRNALLKTVKLFPYIKLF